MKKSDDRPSLVSAQDAAAYLRIDRITIYRMLKKRGIPGAFKIGRVWRLDLDELERFLRKEAQTLK